MDRKCAKNIMSVAAIITGFIATACGKDYAGGVDGAATRRSLPSAQEIAGGSDTLALAVHYVSFRDSSGNVVVDQAAAQKAVQSMSNYWRQCHIEFALESYESIDPSTIGARFNPANYSEIDDIRHAMQNDRTLLMVATGTWNRSGTLGNSGSNCYSSFPDDSADGLVCEQKSAAKDFMLAHEAGHWLNLRHTNDPSADGVEDTNSSNVSANLMDHVVAASHDQVTAGQCYRAREAIGTSRREIVM